MVTRRFITRPNLNMNTTLMVLPLKGEDYGFPQPCPPNWALFETAKKREWLIAKGYPEALLTTNFSVRLVHVPVENKTRKTNESNY